jgi:ParB-like chromosome segregation protein Spo0J
MKEITFPCLDVRLVPAEKVVSNDYNPNKVATPEMRLLRQSIEEDGVTQPVVTFYDAEADRYIVVDGFHRYTVLKRDLRCPEIPVVVIEKDIKDRMASTIRHNRARGKHQVDLMAELVIRLVKLGWDDVQIAEHLGMEAEEVLRLKQLTGLPELFRDQEFSRSWVHVDEEDAA